MRRALLMTAVVLATTLPATAQQMFYINSPNIESSSLTGAGPTVVLTSPSVLPWGLSFDLTNRTMFWLDQTMTIGLNRSDLTGANLQTIITTSSNFGAGEPGLQVGQGTAVDFLRGKLYFTDRQSTSQNNNTGRVCRADLDGSDIEVLIGSGVSGQGVNPRGIAVDMAGAKIYWAENASSEGARIRRANLDGSAAETVVSSGVTNPTFLALDVANDEIYWTDLGTGSFTREIKKYNRVADVTSTVVSAAEVSFPTGLAIDYCTGTLYFGDTGFDAIFARNLSGGAPVQVSTVPLSNISSVVLDICADGNPCTDDDCAGVPGSCQIQNNLATCDDENPCTDPDACSAGACTGTAVDCSSLNAVCSVGVCDPVDGCVAVPANDGSACNDNDGCTVGESCLAGACQGGTTTDCSALDSACTVGVCNTGTGACEAVAGNEGGACEDGNACTAGDSCAAGICVSGGALDCDDADVCTSDDCDPGVGCTYVAVDPVVLLNHMTVVVMSLNINNGIANSLDAKLENALNALDDMNANNDASAINKLNAFQNEVEAQRGNKISDADADALIQLSQQVLDVLNNCG